MTHSLTDLIAHLAKIEVAQHAMEHAALEKCAKIVEKRAKEKIGEYQPQSGPFVGWAELSDYTKADRVSKGFTEDDPLLRTGAMRDSIEHTVHDGVAQVGSNSDIAVYQELGTNRIPPRSFLGGAMADSLEQVKGIIGESLTVALTGDGVFNNRMKIE